MYLHNVKVMLVFVVVVLVIAWVACGIEKLINARNERVSLELERRRAEDRRLWRQVERAERDLEADLAA
jgi:hypothetical protein